MLMLKSVLRRFDWIRLRGFWRQVRDNERKIHRHWYETYVDIQRGVSAEEASSKGGFQSRCYWNLRNWAKFIT